MERLDGEVRNRVKAMSLWLVTGLTLLGVLLGLWAIYVGFLQVRTVPSDVVAVSDDGREVTVELEHTTCQEPAAVHVEERPGVVVLTARVTERIPLREPSCAAGAVSRETAVLDEPLDGRTVVDGAAGPASGPPTVG